jgi:hypothetical protein
MKNKMVFLLLCLLATVVSDYSQNVKPDFRVIISTVKLSDEDKAIPKDNFKVGNPVKLKVEIPNLANKRYNVPKGSDYSRLTLFRDGQLFLIVKK